MRLIINDIAYIPALCSGCGKMFGMADPRLSGGKIYCNECVITATNGMKSYIDHFNSSWLEKYMDGHAHATGLKVKSYWE